MKIKIGILLAAVAMNGAVLAQKDNGNSQGANNGQPFQEITDLIDQNRVLIDANQAGIDDLQQVNGQISVDISAIQTILFDLASQLIGNENDIPDLQSRVDNLEGDYLTLADDLLLLQNNHDADIADLDGMLGDLANQVFDLNMELQSLVISLNSQLTAIQSDVDDNTLAIDALILELTSTTAQAMSNMLSIGILEDMIADLEVRALDHESALDDLAMQIAALDDRIIPLEADSHSNTISMQLIETAGDDVIDNAAMLYFLGSYSGLSSTTYLSIWGVNGGNGVVVQHCIADAQRLFEWLYTGEIIFNQEIDHTGSYSKRTGQQDWLPVTSVKHWNDGYFWFFTTNAQGSQNMGYSTDNSGAITQEIWVNGYAQDNKITYQLGEGTEAACGFTP